MTQCCYFNLNAFVLSCDVSSAEAARETNAELTVDTHIEYSVMAQLSPVVSELQELSHQSDKAFGYSEFYTKHRHTNIFL